MFDTWHPTGTGGLRGPGGGTGTPTGTGGFYISGGPGSSGPSGSSGDAVPFFILFFAGVCIAAILWQAITTPHCGDPSIRNVTLRQMQVVDHSRVTIRELDYTSVEITYRIHTTNRSDQDYKITFCEPDYYNVDLDACEVTYEVDAHSTYTDEWRETLQRMHGWNGPWDPLPRHHQQLDTGHIGMIDDHLVPKKYGRGLPEKYCI